VAGISGVGRRGLKRGLERVDSRADLGRFLAYRIGGHVALLGRNVVVLGEQFGEVEASGRASEVEDGGVVGACCGDGGCVRTQPDSGPLVGLSNLRHPLPPLPHPYSSVWFVLVLLLLLLLLPFLAVPGGGGVGGTAIS